MIKRIGQSPSPLVRPELGTETKNSANETNTQQHVHHNPEKSVDHSKKSFVSLEGEIRQSQLAEELLKNKKEKLSKPSEALNGDPPEADAIAKSLLEDVSLNYTTGEPETTGRPRLKADAVVDVRIKKE